MKAGIAATVLVSAAVAVGAYASVEHHGAHWGYKGASGPAHWGDMKPDFSLCKTGKTQSPIDIRSAAASNLAPLKFQYKEGPLKIIDNGHTIQVNVASGSYLVANGDQYELLQLHFHKPSEETINGKRYDMVAHLVHRNWQGNLGVVAVLLTQGKDNGIIKTIWDNIPPESGKEVTVSGKTLNVDGLLPASRAYYTFAGSLTTPPCTEGVTWFVLKSPVEASAAQVTRFGKIYDNNARNIQPANGRAIKAGE